MAERCTVKVQRPRTDPWAPKGSRYWGVCGATRPCALHPTEEELRTPAPPSTTAELAQLIEGVESVVAGPADEYQLALLCRTAMEKYRAATGKEYDHDDWLD